MISIKFNPVAISKIIEVLTGVIQLNNKYHYMSQ